MNTLMDIVESEGPLSCKLAVDYICQTSDQVGKYHARGLIYGELNPACLLLDDSRRVSIRPTYGLQGMQPGINSRVSIAGERLQWLMGFLAPEQFKDPCVLDVRTDIYALGCVLYFLLTGHSPFVSEDMAQEMAMILYTPPASLNTQAASIPSEVSTVCDRMLAKEPEQRIQSMEEVRNALLGGMTADDSLENM